MSVRNLRRRKFLQFGASAAVAGTALSCSREKSPWRFLTLAEARTLEAVCEQIVPADQDPGAKYANVVRFIDLQLTGFYKSFQPAYREGLAEIDRLSVKMSGAPFANLPFEKQTAVLAEMEKDKAARPFFDTLVAHTMQGFYGTPRHGGNREAASWRMLGLPYPPVRGRAQYDLRKKA